MNEKDREKGDDDDDEDVLGLQTTITTITTTTTTTTANVTTALHSDSLRLQKGTKPWLPLYPGVVAQGWDALNVQSHRRTLQYSNITYLQ